MELKELLTQVFAGSLSAQIELISTFRDFGYNIKIEKIKEEKKMLNIEKYLGAIKEELSKDACASKSCLVAKVRGGGRKPNCDNRLCRDCEEASVDWLFSEYTPPLLENGDGLKPGDWIEVSDDRVTWYKHCFACYYNTMFFVAGDVWSKSFDENGTKITGWKYARLPEDGE